VDREDHAQAWVAGDDRAEGRADLDQRRAEVLATVRRDQGEPGRRGRDRQRVVAAGRHQQGVDHRVADDADRGRIDPLAEQVVARRAGRREVERGELAGQGSILLLGERRVRSPGPQSRLDVTERDLGVITRQGRGQHRGRVPLGEHQIGTLPREDRRERRQGPGGRVGEVLVDPHQIEVDVRDDRKVGQGPVEQGPVLAGGHHPDRQRIAEPAEPDHDRGHLDRLGSRPDDASNLAFLQRHDRGADVGPRSLGRRPVKSP